ncbi:glutamine amidotransferase-like class 1 domain-containing protein 3, mitochondrial isoform X2 [Tubulanus polymorphus]
MQSNYHIAVVLSGCGVYDGSEVHEASACLVHLSRENAKVSMFAPDINQMHVIDHSKGSESTNEKRNVLVESARIARGEVSPIEKLNTADFNAVVFPGGFGAAKNLSTFAVDGAKCSVNKEVDRILREFHASQLPIGLCCISPVLAAKALKGCSVTIGTDANTAQAITDMGSTHVNTEVDEVHVDPDRKIVTTGAFMHDAPIHKIFDGIGKMIGEVIKLANKQS